MTERGGVLISLEGCDGCGKTTQARLLCGRLAAAGLHVGPVDAPGSVVREPGGTPVGETIRDTLLHGPHSPDSWTETLLYAAARAELVARVLLPGLARGRVLVLDRFLDSSLAYQGYARGLGIDAVLAVNQPGMRGLLPDLTVVLDVDPVLSMSRIAGSPDRIEAQGIDFQRRVRRGFAAVAQSFPGRVCVVDGARDIHAVARDVEAAARGVIAGAGLSVS